MLTYLKGVLARTKALFSKPPRKPKLAVIDDMGFVHRGIENLFEPSYDVTCFYRIPDNLDELKPFDVLIVDGSGIGNGSIENGVGFLWAFVPLHREKRYIHYTGLCTSESRAMLTSLGVKIVIKGSRPEELVNAVNGTKED